MPYDSLRRSTRLYRRLYKSVAPAALGLILAAGAARADATLSDLSALSIEELANVPVTSVSRRPQPLSQAPASIYVINQDDIRRTAGTSIPEILRLAPNLQVARVNSASYGISARGFNHSTATSNKLLVLMDGRTVYSPLFSGTFWDAQHTMLADIDRVEVISGPAGTLWGSNAVNGVINITSKNSRETQGTLVDARAGSLQDNLSARHGGMLGTNTSYRVYATGIHNRALSRVDRLASHDGWSNLQGGFRADWADATDTATLQGDLYRGKGEVVPGQIANTMIAGQNLMASWSRQMEDRSTFKLQAYYDHARRTALSGIRATVDTYDISTQYDFAMGETQTIVVGGGYRLTDDLFLGGPATSFLSPARKSLGLGNVFVQDTITLNPALSLTLGVKLEHNDYTGAEFMPDARLAWRATDTSVVWLSAARAVRTPSRFDTELFATTTFAGGAGFVSEDLLAFELGYRGQPLSDVSVSVSAFFNIYDDLRTVEATTPTVFPLMIKNGMDGNTYGAAAWGTYAATDWWRLKAGANVLRKELHLKPGSRDFFGVAFAGNDPSFQFQAQSDMDLGQDVNFNVSLRSIDALASPRVGAYTEADAKISWRVVDNLQLSLAGMNLLHERHVEFINGSLPPLAIPRSVYLSAQLELP